jgi:hypothetical protein
MSAVSLDHVGVCSDAPQDLWAAYERLGFTLTPVARQSGPRTPSAVPERLATGNRCAMLRHGYLELLGIIEPSLFDNGLSRFLARYQGLHILAFGVEDAPAELPRLRRAGFDIPGVVPLQRPVDDAAPDGPLARFSRLPMPDAPEGRLQLIEHHTPELIWQERWMDHANHAVALDAAILVVKDPAETGARLSRLTGGVLEPDPAGGFGLPFREGRLRILPPSALEAVLPGVVAPTLPFIAGFVVRTDDGNAAARALLAGLETRDAPDGLMVPPELAGGAAMVLAPYPAPGA